MKNASPIITLTTDFGLHDPYVGQMKGALLSVCPQARLVDITHHVPPWNIAAAAVTLATSYLSFPPHSVHLVVVDPGVGGERAIVAAQGREHFFVCPDNGILSLLLEEGHLERVYQIEASLTRKDISPTFHGRDIMAPAAAALAAGKALAALGPSLPLTGLKQLHFPLLNPGQGALEAQVLSIDHFGNIRTTVRTGQNAIRWTEGAWIRVGGQKITTCGSNYSQVGRGELLVLIDSSGFVEIAANQASAAAFLGCSPGDPVVLFVP